MLITKGQTKCLLDKEENLQASNLEEILIGIIKYTTHHYKAGIIIYTTHHYKAGIITYTTHHNKAEIIPYTTHHYEAEIIT